MKDLTILAAIEKDDKQRPSQTQEIFFFIDRSSFRLSFLERAYNKKIPRKTIRALPLISTVSSSTVSKSSPGLWEF